jgi:hypothetical protein
MPFQEAVCAIRVGTDPEEGGRVWGHGDRDPYAAAAAAAAAAIRTAGRALGRGPDWVSASASASASTSTSLSTHHAATNILLPPTPHTHTTAH